MATAYLATSGDYSDYTVKRVFLDKALADKYLADGLCDEIAEFEITETEIKAVSILRVYWNSAHTRPSGPVAEGEWSCISRVEDTGQPACAHQVDHHEESCGWGAYTTLIVEGHDHDRVRKVLSEQVAQIKAELGEPGSES